jgi:hypothetical protein
MTPIEAFEMAIELAITAPTEAKASQAVELAESIAMQLTPQQVKAVKEKFEVVQ